MSEQSEQERGTPPGRGLEQIEHPGARRALGQAHDALDGLTEVQAGVLAQRGALRDALGHPGLEAAFDAHLEAMGGVMQDIVHTSRADLDRIAGMQVREEQQQRGADGEGEARDG